MPKIPKHPEIARILLSHRSERQYPPYGGGAGATSKAARVLEAHLLSSTAVPATTVGDLIAAFVGDTRHRALASSTLRRYKRALRLLLAALGTKPVAAVTVSDAAALYTGTEKNAQGSTGRSSEASRRETIETARILWNFGQSCGMCTTNPFRTIRVKPRLFRHPVLWTVDQLTTFIAAADAAKRPSIGTAAALAYWLFLRPRDVLAVRHDDFDGTSLLVSDGWFGKMRLRIDPNPDLLARVRGLLGTSPGTLSGEAPWGELQAFRRAFARIRQQAGLPIGLTFRALPLSRLLALHEAGAIPLRFASSWPRRAHFFTLSERAPKV